MVFYGPKVHSLSKQFCTIFILWKTYHSHQTFPTCQSWHQLFILWKTYHCAELLLSEWALVQTSLWVVWTEQHKLYTPFLPRAPGKKSNETKQKSCSYSYLSNKRTCPLIREVRVRAYCPTKYIYCVWEPHISSDILCIFFSSFYFLRATFIDQFGQLDASGVRIFIASSQKCQKMLFKMGQKQFVSCI